MLGRTMRQFIRDNRRSAPMSAIASMCEKYLRAWHNEGYFEFDHNGERFAISRFAGWAGFDPIQVWDVGAHHGEWAEEAHAILPAAHITSFEILPPVAEALVARHAGADWLTIRNLGLSDQEGSVEVTWNRDHDTTNAIAPRSASKWFASHDLESVRCPVSTIDRLIADGAPPPDLLKIDVEGHDAFVLDGAKTLLASPRAPGMIQFEYGDTWIPAGRLLNQSFELLIANGYQVGRLYPRYVEFRPFAYEDEKFRMGNMIAVKDERLKAMLAA